MKTTTIAAKFTLFLSLWLSGHLVSQELIPSEFKTKLFLEKGILIDVRTSQEFSQESIEKSTNLNVNDSLLFLNGMKKLDKEKTYFLYCGMGKRSAKALSIMKQNDFKKVYDLAGGLDAWKKAGFATIKPEVERSNKQN